MEGKVFEDREKIGEDYPFISVITPSYNQVRFLRDNLVSVLNQCYTEYEHIIIDGGSTDGTVDILKSYDKRISYWVSEPDRGQSDALNKGLAAASGEVIGWQNSDDFYLPGAFHFVGETFRENPEIDVIYGDYLYVNEGNRIVGSKKYTPCFDIREYLYVGANISNQSVFFRREALEKVGGFDVDLHLAMDFDLFLKLSAFARFKHVRTYLGAYRVHGEQKGQTHREEDREEYRLIRERAGVIVRDDIPWKKQYPVRKFYCRTRRNLFKLIYTPLYLRDPYYRGQ
jgi:glycosyltransferase involved in cell wall biosynthesis